ncbi:hypothetical protein ACR6HW_14310 [Fusibacter sp. JL298sf-3]
MTNSKIYYLKQTGEVILHIPENYNPRTKPTTREQDEAIYTPLQTYNPQEVALLELESGQYANDFLSATSYRVNLDTMVLEFSYPVFNQPLTERLNQLKTENVELKSKLSQAELDNLITLEALAEVYELFLAMQS